MKRHIVTTIALLLCCCLLLAPAAAEQSADNILYGDVDGSGKIDTGDALKALQWTVGLTGLTAGQRLLGDVSADGLVNATDALYILQYTVELINRFRAQEQSFALNPYTSQLSDRSGAPAKTLEGIVTTFQMGAQYNGLYELPADSVMVYIDSLGAVAAAFDSWKENQGGIRVDYMIPAGRDNGEYLTLYPDRADKDSHSNQAGEFHLHPGGVRYMMPTPSYMEYKWDVIEQCLERGPGAIVLEEPETFNLYCYADGFKEAWDDYYGTPFADPAESAENRYQANKLFAHMWSVFLYEIGRRIEESHPEVDFIVATHSIASYGSWDMTSSISDTAVLSNIKINGGAVEVAGFAGHKSYYDVTVPKTVTNLDIQAYPADRSDLVQVIGPVSMNEDEPVFVNILVTSPSEETYSIYTLRLSYDSFLYTEKYSSFQLLAYLLLAGVGLFVIGFFTAWYKANRRKPDIEKTPDLPEVEREVASVENVPMA